MSSTTIGIILGLMFVAVIIALWRRYKNVASILIVAGVGAVAIAVTIVQIDRYREQRASASNAATQAPADTATGIAAEPPAPPPVIVPAPPPLMHGPTGGAAPPAARNPYLGGKS